jgi:TfoX/Sxy family transcriptional regulator of competence genes
MSIASDELAERVRAIVGHKPGVVEKRMFGGIGFMLFGNMVVAAMKSGALLARVGPERYEEAKRRPGAAEMHMGKRRMSGFLEVTDEGIDSDEALKDWLDYSETFVRTLPPK